MGLTSIDFNADLAEECGDDEAIFKFLSSANICCGRHAGGPEAMRKAVALAIENNVAIGAHVGYADRENFGRIEVEMAYDDLYALASDQIYDLLEIVDAAGGVMRYVKPHGALYHRIGTDPIQAAAVCAAIADINPELCVLVPDTDVIKHALADAGLTFTHEFFADRAYLPTGTLMPRTEPNSVLEDHNFVAHRVIDWLDSGTVVASDGSEISINAKSVCLHGDTPGAVDSARHIYELCQANNIQIRSWLD